MEAINVHFGGGLIQNMQERFPGSLNHRGTRHTVEVSDPTITKELQEATFEVNSHHNLGIDNSALSTKLRSFAVAPDRSIEGVYHPYLPIAAVMWHPERESMKEPLSELLVQAFLSRKMFWKSRK